MVAYTYGKINTKAMPALHFKKVAIRYRDDIPKAKQWRNTIAKWIRKNYPKINVISGKKTPRTKKDAPDLLIVLGGDGTILEAIRAYHMWNPLFLGLNLGHIGFTASVREEKYFIPALELLFRGRYKTIPRLMISAALTRNGKTIENINAINEIVVQNLLGMVHLEVAIEDHPLQYIHGTGVLVATATGSTAYNLSAHGPIIMPDIRCFVVTELLDHNIPTPSIIIKRNRTITVTVQDFRKQNLFTITKSGAQTDVVLSSDGQNPFPLQKGDVITMKESKYEVRFAEIEDHYFFKSIQEKFAFR